MFDRLGTLNPCFWFLDSEPIGKVGSKVGETRDQRGHPETEPPTSLTRALPVWSDKPNIPHNTSSLRLTKPDKCSVDVVTVKKEHLEAEKESKMDI